MRIVYFTHSLASCWNHGNAHFQRGVLRALQAAGHEAAAYEPDAGWSRENLLAEHGSVALDNFTRTFPTLRVQTYADAGGLAEAVDGADLVLVHEWTDPDVVRQVGTLRRHNAFTLLFHDTHHRAVSDPEAVKRFDLSGYDGVLAFGATLARVYESWGWGDRVWVWHEAADTALFHPPAHATERRGAVWVGNWGDGERNAELEEFLFASAQHAGVTLDVHGVRYPDDALATLRRYGARYHGWIANAAVPDVFARHRFTVHVPRRHYTQALPGIPTIRVFEALACGIPLLTAPWQDSEDLFRPGEDFLVGRDGAEMAAHMRALLHDDALAAALVESGLARVRARHSCDVRVRELLAIAARLRGHKAAA